MNNYDFDVFLIYFYIYVKEATTTTRQWGLEMFKIQIKFVHYVLLILMNWKS